MSGGVSLNVRVALKNGWVPLSNGLRQIDSIGWVNGDGRNCLIAVLWDNNPWENYGIMTVITLSSLIWIALAPH